MKNLCFVAYSFQIVPNRPKWGGLTHFQRTQTGSLHRDTPETERSWDCCQRHKEGCMMFQRRAHNRRWMAVQLVRLHQNTASADHSIGTIHPRSDTVNNKSPTQWSAQIAGKPEFRVYPIQLNQLGGIISLRDRDSFFLSNQIHEINPG